MNYQAHILTFLDEALLRAVEAEAAELRMQELMKRTLAARMPVGQIIDTTPVVGLAGHLRSVRTVKGHDRGTRKFRITAEVAVEASALNLMGAQWYCKARPINEKTGKDMSGATSARGSGDDVSLKGYIFAREFGPALDPKAANERDRQAFLAFIEGTTGAPE